MYKFSDYFENEVLRKRAYLKKEWCIKIVESPLHSEQQTDDRMRYWGSVAELPDKILRVIVLSDGVTIHNAFPDRGFKQES